MLDRRTTEQGLPQLEDSLMVALFSDAGVEWPSSASAGKICVSQNVCVAFLAEVLLFRHLSEQGLPQQIN